MNNIIKKVEAEHINENATVPEIGDTVKVGMKIIEGNKERVQYFEGIVISLNGRGINLAMTIRKISFGIGVEKVIPVYSPKVASVKIVKSAKVRRAKLYYLRERVGKAATRLKVRTPKK